MRKTTIKYRMNYYLYLIVVSSVSLIIIDFLNDQYSFYSLNNEKKRETTNAKKKYIKISMRFVN